MGEVFLERCDKIIQYVILPVNVKFMQKRFSLDLTVAFLGNYTNMAPHTLYPRSRWPWKVKSSFKKFAPHFIKLIFFFFPNCNVIDSSIPSTMDFMLLILWVFCLLLCIMISYDYAYVKHPNCFSLAGNLLNNYCPDDDLANVARFIFAFTIVLTYPIQVFISREVS